MERGTTPLLLVLQFSNSDRVNMCPVRRSSGYIKGKKKKKKRRLLAEDITLTIIRCVLEEEHPWNRSSNRLYPDYGVLSLFLPAFVEEKKILRPDATRFFFLWFIFPYHAGAPARNNRTTIYYTLQDQSMGKTRDLLLPRSFSSRKN